MFYIVHSPRFPLLAALKSIFGIGTNDQRFGYSSKTMNIDYFEHFWWKQESQDAH